MEKKFLDKQGLAELYHSLKDKFANKSDVPTKLSQLEEDETHKVVTQEEKENWDKKLDDKSDISKNKTTVTIGGYDMTETVSFFFKQLFEGLNGLYKSKGKADGIATLAGNARVPLEQLPDEVVQKDDLTDYAKREELDNKVDKVSGKALSTNDYTNADRAKVDAIPDNPKYTDTTYDLSGYAKKTDVKSSLSEMTSDSTHRTVTDSEKSTWNNKVDKVSDKALSSNDYTDVDKTKLQTMPVPIFLEKEQYNSLSEQEKIDNNKIYYIYAGK